MYAELLSLTHKRRRGLTHFIIHLRQDKGKGTIAKDKFVATVSRLLGGDQEKAKAMFDAFDIDGSGYVLKTCLSRF